MPCQALIWTKYTACLNDPFIARDKNGSPIALESLIDPFNKKVSDNMRKRPDLFGEGQPKLYLTFCGKTKDSLCGTHSKVYPKELQELVNDDGQLIDENQKFNKTSEGYVKLCKSYGKRLTQHYQKLGTQNNPNQILWNWHWERNGWTDAERQDFLPTPQQVREGIFGKTFSTPSRVSKVDKPELPKVVEQQPKTTSKGNPSILLLNEIMLQ